MAEAALIRLPTVTCNKKYRSRVLPEVLQGLQTRTAVRVCFELLNFEESKLVADAIGGNPLLETLDLQESKLGTARGLRRTEVLAAGLGASSVTDLNLSNCGLGDEGCRAFAEVLKDSSVTKLGLASNFLGRNSQVGVGALAASLKSSRLISLDLSRNSLGTTGARTLAAGLQGSSVTYLDLSTNALGDGGASFVAGALRQSSVKSLRLSVNLIRVMGTRALAEGLQDSNVTYLDLSFNCMTEEVVRELAARVGGTSIQSLDLSYNYTVSTQEEGDGASLLEGLRDTSVTELKLCCCVLPRGRLSQIKAVIQSNKARSFVLQMEAQSSQHEVILKFRSLAGTEAAVLSWSLDRPVHELPEAVLRSMRSSGFQPPFKGLSAGNLKIVPSGGEGALLDVGPAAAPLKQQLGLSMEPPSGSKRCGEEGGAPAASSKRSRSN